MINIKATIRGEPDTQPFTKNFDYDEQVFSSSAGMIKEKIQRNMKVNANEALMLFCDCVTRSIHAGKDDGDIQKCASEILSANNVMIGVPETLQIITFEVALKNKLRKVVIKKPIHGSGYIMAGH